MKALWKLGRELMLVWPAHTKKDALINLIIARLRVTGNFNTSSDKDPVTTQITLGKKHNKKLKPPDKSMPGRVVSNDDNWVNKSPKSSQSQGPVVPKDDIIRSNKLPSLIQVEKVIKKRRQRKIFRSSPNGRPNAKRKRHERKQINTTHNLFRGWIGGVEHRRICKFNIKQLRALAEVLELRIPKNFKKHQIREQIISFCISSSSDWKRWSKATKHWGDDYSSPSADFKRHWSPPKASQHLQLPGKYPEKGVRVMKVSEAYPDDKSALTDQTTADLENNYSIFQEKHYLDSSKPTVRTALSPIEEYSKPHYHTKKINRGNVTIDAERMSCTEKLMPKPYPSITVPRKCNAESTLIRLQQKSTNRELGAQNDSHVMPGITETGIGMSIDSPTVFHKSTSSTTRISKKIATQCIFLDKLPTSNPSSIGAVKAESNIAKKKPSLDDDTVTSSKPPTPALLKLKTIGEVENQHTYDTRKWSNPVRDVQPPMSTGEKDGIMTESTPRSGGAPICKYKTLNTDSFSAPRSQAYDNRRKEKSLEIQHFPEPRATIPLSPNLSNVTWECPNCRCLNDQTDDACCTCLTRKMMSKNLKDGGNYKDNDIDRSTVDFKSSPVLRASATEVTTKINKNLRVNERKEMASPSSRKHKPLSQSCSYSQNRPDAIKQREIEQAKSTILSSIMETDGPVSMDKLTNLTINQLEKLGSELCLSFNSEWDKQRLLEHIIYNLKQKTNCRNSPGHNTLPKSFNQEKPISWSPPKEQQKRTSIIITDKHPEEGVRVMKTSEAWAKEKTAEDWDQTEDTVCFNSAPNITYSSSQPESSLIMDIDNESTEWRMNVGSDLRSRICELKTEWSKREKCLKDLQRISDEKVRALQEQLNTVISERNNLQCKLLRTPSAAKLSLESMLNSPYVQELKYGNCNIGLALKLDRLKETVADLRNSFDKLFPSHEKTQFHLVKGGGSCVDSNFPLKPKSISESFKKQLLGINEELGKPGLNVAGLLELTSSPVNVSNFLCNAPANVIWINAGDSQLLAEITTNSDPTRMTLNPGMAVVLDAKIALSLSTAPSNLNDWFQVSNNRSRSCALCLTTGVEMWGSWLNALNSEALASASWNQDIVSQPSSDLAKNHPIKRKWNLNQLAEANTLQNNHQDTDIDSDTAKNPNLEHKHSPKQLSEKSTHELSIQDRLEQLGATLKCKSFIRVAPLKKCNLSPSFLESKVNLIGKWTSNLKELNPGMTLPEIKRVVSAWETPRGGERFKIVKIYFKSTNGLAGMKDLMLGSKLDLVEGLPTELERIRDKIYVTLPNFWEKPFIRSC